MKRLIARSTVVFCLVSGSIGLWLVIQPSTENAFTATNKGKYLLASGLLKNAAGKGDLAANTSLANFYKLGLGVTKDARKAVSLYALSASGGDLSAMVNLALMYRDGIGIEQNPELAYAWLNLAHTRRSDVAKHYMSEMLASDQLSPKAVPDLKSKYQDAATMPAPIFEDQAPD